MLGIQMGFSEGEGSRKAELCVRVPQELMLFWKHKSLLEFWERQKADIPEEEVICKT